MSARKWLPVWQRIPGSSPQRWRRIGWRRFKPFRADQHIKGLRPVREVPREDREVYKRTIIAAARVAEQFGEVWHCRSSYRTYAEQAALYAAYVNGTGSLAAKPGTSRHEKGNALDLGDARNVNIGNSAVRRAALERAGFVFAVPSEPWHVEYQG